MRWIRPFKFNESLLSLKGNVDHELISKIVEIVPKGGKILEISCGNCADSLYLKNLGYEVVATELDPNYVKNANDLGIKCIQHDTKESFPFKNGEFNLVYSRLSLHYFSDSELVKIFSEIRRISKSIVFTVKIQDDNLKTGKVIHPPKFWKELTQTFFEISNFEIHKGKLYGQDSTWLEVVASAN